MKPRSRPVSTDLPLADMGYFLVWTARPRAFALSAERPTLAISGSVYTQAGTTSSRRPGALPARARTTARPLGRGQVGQLHTADGVANGVYPGRGGGEGAVDQKAALSLAGAAPGGESPETAGECGPRPAARRPPRIRRERPSCSGSTGGSFRRRAPGLHPGAGAPGRRAF